MYLRHVDILSDSGVSDRVHIGGVWLWTDDAGDIVEDRCLISWALRKDGSGRRQGISGDALALAVVYALEEEELMAQ